MATEVDAQIRVYDATTGKSVRSFAGRDHEYQPTFSPDGTLLATCGGKWEIMLYEFATGRLVREWKASSPATALAFSPDGAMLASGHSHMPLRVNEGDVQGDKIYLWNTENGQELRQMQTTHGIVSKLCFSPDGRLIASCGSDHHVRLWERESGQVRRAYIGQSMHVASVDFSPEGRRLVSASSDGTAILWRLFEPGTGARSEAEFTSLWNDLTKDGATAHRAMGELIAASGTPAFLNKQLKPAIREALENQPELLRELRGVEILEHIDGDLCRRTLRELAAGAPRALPTLQAKSSLARLERK